MQFWSFSSPWAIAILMAIIGLVLFIILSDYRRKKSAFNRAIVRAVINIDASGSYHVELLPASGIHPVDLVQLATSYLANMLVCTDGFEPVLRQSLWQLIGVVKAQDNSPNESQYRNALEHLANYREPSLHSSGKYSIKNSEQFRTFLVRGKNFDYALTEFSLVGYKPNHTYSCVLLINAIKNYLDSGYLALLHGCLVGILMLYGERKLSLANNGITAFSIVEYCLKSIPERATNSPGRLTRRIV